MTQIYPNLPYSVNCDWRSSHLEISPEHRGMFVWFRLPLQLEIVWVVTVHSFYRDWGPVPVLHNLRPGM